jgi:hypothetical protein
MGSVFGVALVVVLLGARPTLAEFRTVFLTELGLALLTSAISLAIDTRPGAATTSR